MSVYTKYPLSATCNGGALHSHFVKSLGVCPACAERKRIDEVREGTRRLAESSKHEVKNGKEV